MKIKILENIYRMLCRQEKNRKIEKIIQYLQNVIDLKYKNLNKK